jgi:Uma2 family endonuclease
LGNTMIPNLVGKPASQSDLEVDSPEQRLILDGVGWHKYEALLEILGDDFPGLHLTYLEGTLELMSPSRKHEFTQKNIAKLLEAYLEEARIRHYPLGSTTFRKQEKSRGIEPDECYCIGEDKEFPDLAIEVVISSGGIDSLEVYKGLKVSEVWFWKNNQFSLYRLRSDEYEQITSSEILPELDINLLASYVNYAEPLDAVLEFRQRVRQQIQQKNE